MTTVVEHETLIETASDKRASCIQRPVTETKREHRPDAIDQRYCIRMFPGETFKVCPSQLLQFDSRPRDPKNPSPTNFSMILRPTAMATVAPEKVPDTRPGSGARLLRYNAALP